MAGNSGNDYIYITYVDVYIRWSNTERTKAEHDRLKHWYKAWMETDTAKECAVFMVMSELNKGVDHSDMYILMKGSDENVTEGHAIKTRKFFEEAGYETTMDLPFISRGIPKERLL